MMKMKAVALTEKGVVRPQVRKSLVSYVAKHQDTIFAKAERVDQKAVWCLPVEDSAGNTVYINFDITITTKNPCDRAERKAKPKSSGGSSNFEIE